MESLASSKTNLTWTNIFVPPCIAPSHVTASKEIQHGAATKQPPLLT